MDIQRITTGYVNQVFDTVTKMWVSQEFVSCDHVEYIKDYNDDMSYEEFKRLTEGNDYLPFDMVQPK